MEAYLCLLTAAPPPLLPPNASRATPQPLAPQAPSLQMTPSSLTPTCHSSPALPVWPPLLRLLDCTLPLCPGHTGPHWDSCRAFCLVYLPPALPRPSHSQHRSQSDPKPGTGMARSLSRRDTAMPHSETSLHGLASVTSPSACPAACLAILSPLQTCP